MLSSKAWKLSHEEKLKIRNQELIIKVGVIDHRRIKLWEDNPRMGEFIDNHKGVVDEEELENMLIEEEDVTTLAKEIEADGQINEPIMVYEKGNAVVEGNRRLVANRILYKKNSELWRDIPVKIIPKEVHIDVIEQYLGDLHLKGKRTWSPYNKARFLGKKINWEEPLDDQFKTLSQEFKYTLPDVKKASLTYKDMEQHNVVDKSMYSQMEILNTNKDIKGMFESIPDSKKKIIKSIKQNKLGTDLEFRKFMPAIIQTGDKKLIKKVINQEIDWERAVEVAKNQGTTRAESVTIERFSNFISETSKIKRILLGFQGPNFTRTKQQLRKIAKNAKFLYEEMNKKN